MQPRAARRRAALSGIRVRSRIAPSSTRRRRTWPRSSSGVNNTSTAKPRPVRLQRNRPARRRSSAPPLRRIGLMPPGGEVTVLVSGGADSTCAWHLLRELGYRVSALHVNHGLRGEESEADARFCRELMGAEIVDGRGGRTENELREIRYGFATDRLRATGHTASDQVETILYRLVTSGRATGIKPKREDGVVRPLLPLWRDETVAYCRAHGLAYRIDSTNRDTTRGLIRER